MLGTCNPAQAAGRVSSLPGTSIHRHAVTRLVACPGHARRSPGYYGATNSYSGTGRGNAFGVLGDINGRTRTLLTPLEHGGLRRSGLWWSNAWAFPWDHSGLTQLCSPISDSSFSGRSNYSSGRHWQKPPAARSRITILIASSGKITSCTNTKARSMALAVDLYRGGQAPGTPSGRPSVLESIRKQQAKMRHGSHWLTHRHRPGFSYRLALDTCSSPRAR